MQLINLNINDAGTYICSAVVSGLYESVNLGEGDNSVHNENFTKNMVVELARIEVNVRTVPGPVATFKCRATTIIAVIIWEIWPNRTGGYPLLDFTAEMRRMPDYGENETEWMLLDPHHIGSNAVSTNFDYIDYVLSLKGTFFLYFSVNWKYFISHPTRRTNSEFGLIIN